VLSSPEGQEKLISSYPPGGPHPPPRPALWYSGEGFFGVEFSIFPLHTTPLCYHGRVLALDIFLIPY